MRYKKTNYGETIFLIMKELEITPKELALSMNKTIDRIYKIKKIKNVRLSFIIDVAKGLNVSPIYIIKRAERSKGDICCISREPKIIDSGKSIRILLDRLNMTPIELRKIIGIENSSSITSAMIRKSSITDLLHMIANGFDMELSELLCVDDPDFMPSKS